MKRPPAIEPNAIDKLVTWLSPERGLARYRSRVMLAMSGGYTGGRRDRRQTSGWSTATGSADSDILPDLPLMRERSRALVSNAPLATGAVNTVVTNVVGTGLKLQARVDRDALAGVLGTTDEEFDAWERAAEREFRTWAESTDCDVTRTQNFAGIQELAMRSVLMSGDTLVARRFPDRGQRIATALQVIEGDRLANAAGTRDTPEMAGGVKRDSYGAPVAYRILRQHPGDAPANLSEADEIAAFGPSGLRQVYHLFHKTRPGQTRGVPYLAPVIESLKQLDQYREAEMMAAVIGAMFTVFIKTEDGEGLAPMQPTAETGGAASDKDFKLSPGAMLNLLPNESVEFANPGRPNVAFDPFTQAILRQIGVALELPFEILIKHFTASYSAAQAALVEAWKFFRARRAWLASGLCQPVYEAVIYEAVARGHLAAPGFMGDPFIRAAYLGAQWVGPPRGQINQQVEVKAARDRVEGGFSTLAFETAEMTGEDWERNHAQSVKEHRARVEGGLIPPTIVPSSSTSTDPNGPDIPGETVPPQG